MIEIDWENLTWTTAANKTLLVSEMTLDHLLNVAIHLRECDNTNNYMYNRIMQEIGRRCP